MSRWHQLRPYASLLCSSFVSGFTSRRLVGQTGSVQGLFYVLRERIAIMFFFFTGFVSTTFETNCGKFPAMKYNSLMGPFCRVPQIKLSRSSQEYWVFEAFLRSFPRLRFCFDKCIIFEYHTNIFAELWNTNKDFKRFQLIYRSNHNFISFR